MINESELVTSRSMEVGIPQMLLGDESQIDDYEVYLVVGYQIKEMRKSLHSISIILLSVEEMGNCNGDADLLCALYNTHLRYFLNPKTGELCNEYEHLPISNEQISFLDEEVRKIFFK